MITEASTSLSRILRDIGRSAGMLLVFDTCVAIAYVKFGWDWLSMPHIPLAIFGGVIGAIVGFRNTSSYARWWEARTLWGQVVNHSRSLGRQTLSMIEPAEDVGAAPVDRSGVQRQIILLQVAYVHALRCQLRALLPWKDLERVLGAESVDGSERVETFRYAFRDRLVRCWPNALSTDGSTAFVGQQSTEAYRTF